MSLSIGTAGSGDQAAGALFLGTAGSGNQPVLAGYIGTAGSGNQPFFAALSETIAPSPARASRSVAGTATVNPTATPSGGIGPYTYAWSQVSGDSMTLASATSATCTISGVVNADDTALDGFFKCIVTDTGTGATASASVGVTLTYTGVGS